ncbi:MAG: pantoate--beta-alanine ligase [Albidovulum sp.]
MKPKLVRTVAALRRETAKWRAEGLRYAVVPTMGAIHSGHTQLVTEGLKRADRVITTIFVNPKQFAAHEDLGKYPRDEDGDVRKLGKAGTHLIFSPAPDEIYPPGFSTTISLAGPAKAGLEDKFRPLFFDGVATVVAKLFTQTGADIAMFGEKDYQQLQVVTRMAKDLDIAIEVIGVPTVRETDGLAKSSRNRLPVENRAPAGRGHLPQPAECRRTDPLRRQSSICHPFRDPHADHAGLQGRLRHCPQRRNSEHSTDQGEPLRLIAAAWLGKTRLIDNIAV